MRGYVRKSSKWFSSIAASAVLLFAVGGARAQSASDAPPPPPPGRQFHFERSGSGPMMGFEDVGFVGFERGLGGKTVTGAPFSATFSSQSTQVLTDGNRIQHSTTGTIARDGQGRTHRDMTLPAIGQFASSGQTARHVIFINDPVAGVHYVLHPDEKSANKMTPPPNGRHGGKGAGEANGASGAGWRQHQKEVVTTSLGTQMINGISAEGTRYTRTIPAGKIGNEKPITIVTEKWYSSELQMVVMTKRTDPFRGGDTVSQLTNIQRQEPAATMFQVPADYSVQEGGPRHGNAMRGSQQQPQ
jgi:hypothetical protein